MSLASELKQVRKISDMIVGEIGYTVPWALDATPSKSLWIRGDYAVHKLPEGTAMMRIRRTETGMDVFKRSVADEEFSFSFTLAPLQNQPLTVQLI